MTDLDRKVAGITCREVLAHLSEYLDGELDDARAARVEAHVQGCLRCERFGGAFAGVVGALRRSLADAAPAPEPNLVRRLRARLPG